LIPHQEPPMRTIPAAVLLQIVLALAVPASPAHAQTTRIANMPYGDGHERHVLDVYVPTEPGQSPRPLVLWIHGGGWRSGNKGMPAARVNGLIARGFIVASTNYRYSQQARSPAQIHDCKAAIRFLRANAAAYGIDPARIGVWGSSAGGHLAAHMGVSGAVLDAEGAVGPHGGVSSRVQAAADYFGPTDFFNVPGWHTGTGTAEEQLLGFTLGDVQANVNNPAWAPQVALARLTGVTTHVSADDPPFHIAHGTDDSTVWPLHSQLLHDALRAAGVPSTLRLVPETGHGLPVSEDTFVFEFFDRILDGCRADWNWDGVADFNDLLGFLNSSSMPDPRADLNGDGVVDFNDLLEFLNLYSAGC
jgi:acetyl esterase/lipase